jgi:hypothetical protein
MPDAPANTSNLNGIGRLLNLWGQGTLRIPSLSLLPTGSLLHVMAMTPLGAGAGLHANCVYLRVRSGDFIGGGRDEVLDFPTNGGRVGETA